MEERWKVYKIVKGRNFRGIRIYEVSDWGNVKVNGVLVDWSRYKNIKRQYYTVGCFYVHRAVAELFIPNPNNYPCVDHIDTNKHNNHYTNLRWCTQKMNTNNPLTRKHNSEAQKLAYKNNPDLSIQISIRNTGSIPWNKNLPKELQPMYGKEPWNKGKKMK